MISCYFFASGDAISDDKTMPEKIINENLKQAVRGYLAQ